MSPLAGPPIAVRAIGDLPFHERPLTELLGFDGDRETVNVDYAGFGWARADRVWLTDATGARRVDDALVLGLHSADDGEALPDDIELEFELDGGTSVSALLSVFLARWLPRLPEAPALVLAVCNRHRARVAAPPAAGAAAVHYGVGNVDAWLDLSTHDGDRLRLVAGEWRRAERAVVLAP